MNLSDCYFEGKEAFSTKKTDCPYSEETQLEQYDAWWEGWLDAREEKDLGR